MWYRGSITVPADTAEADYVSVDIGVAPGVITKFYRLFPSGCAGKAHLQIFWQTRQIFPTTSGESYLGDASEVLGDASIALDEPEYVLKLRAWAQGTTYQHTIYCEFYIEKPRILVPVPIELMTVSIPTF